jgi:hypothetical protein
MRQTHRAPPADLTKSDALSNNVRGPNRDAFAIARSFARSFATRANTSWRYFPHWIAGSFSRTGMLVVLFFLFSIAITAQDSPQLKPDRIDITPLVGPAYGLAVGFRIRNEDLIEFRWTRQDSDAQVKRSNATLPASLGTTDWFHCDFSHEYVILNHREVRPYIVASVGATNIFSGSSYSSTHISVGVGGGVKFFVSRHLGFRMQAEWLPTFISPAQSLPCTAVCVVGAGGTVASQAQVTFGPIIHF